MHTTRTGLFSGISLSVLSLLAPLPALAQCGFSLAPGTNIATAVSGSIVVVADVNGDGRRDVITCNVASGRISTLLGNGNGTIGSVVNSPFSQSGTPMAMIAGDFNGDGRIDVAIITGGFSNNIVILQGNGTGSFSILSTATTTVTGGLSGYSLAAADLNHDGILDLVCTFSNGTNFNVFRGVGNGTFLAPQVFSSISGNPSAVVIADFNGDGHADLAFSQDFPSFKVFIGNGTGNSFTAYASFSASSPFSYIASGDFDGDGRPDIAVGGSGPAVQVYHNTGTTFTLTASVPVSGLRGLIATDLSNDGRLDLVGTTFPGNQFMYALGQAGNTFSTPVSVPTASVPIGIAAADLNGDGSPDLVVACPGSAVIQEFLNIITVTPTVTTQPVSTTTVITGQPASFTVAGSGGALTYQWRRNYTNLPNGGAVSGATSTTLTINPTAITDNLSFYDCVITNNCGSTPSAFGILEVLNCPADFNHDGSVDFFDYLDFVDAYSIGC